MVRSLIIWALATYGLAVVQSSVSSHLAIAEVAPDLLLVWTVCVGLLHGPAVGAVCGWASGVLQGALEQRWLGAYGVGKTLSGFLAGQLGQRMFRENWLVPMVCAAALTLVHELCFLLLAGSPALWARAARVVGTRVAYHLVLAPFALAALRRAEQTLARRAWQPE